MNRPTLIDTHALLWLVENDPRLGTRAREIIVNGDSPLLFSHVSVWELVVKHTTGKLKLTLPISEFIEQRITAAGIELLPIRLAHILMYDELPLHHRDPFDRLLAAQCLSDGMSILTRDELFDRYGVETVWD